MDCPACKGAMIIVEHAGIEVNCAIGTKAGALAFHGDVAAESAVEILADCLPNPVFGLSAQRLANVHVFPGDS